MKDTCYTQSYEDELKTKIGRYAAENGNSRALTKFSRELGWAVPKSTIRSFKRAYLKELKCARILMKCTSRRNDVVVLFVRRA